MKTRRGYLLLMLVVGSVVSGFSQKTHPTITVGLLYDNVIDQPLPSYIVAHGGAYKLHSKGIRSKTAPTLGVTLGYQLNHQINKRFGVYTGLSFTIRKLEYKYVDASLLSRNPRPPRWLRDPLHIEVNKTFSSLTLPIGGVFHLNDQFFFDLGGRVYMTLISHGEEICKNKDMKYKLHTLGTRSPNKFGLEVAGGVGYTVGRSTVSCKYVYGLTPIYPLMHNAYNQMVPSKLNFSSVMLSYSIDVGGHLLRKRKVD